MPFQVELLLFFLIQGPCNDFASPRGGLLFTYGGPKWKMMFFSGWGPGVVEKLRPQAIRSMKDRARGPIVGVKCSPSTIA